MTTGRYQIAAVKVAAILVLDLIGVTLFLSAAFRSELFDVRLLLWLTDSLRRDGTATGRPCRHVEAETDSAVSWPI